MDYHCRSLEHDREREQATALDLHLDFVLALPCTEATFRAEDKTIVNVSGYYPNGKLTPPTETPDTMNMHVNEPFYPSVT